MRGCLRLGLMYSGTRGIDASPARAVPYFQQACDGGEAMGCSKLAPMYEMGDAPLTRDFAKAAALYRKSCDAGLVADCYSLGRLLKRADGIPADLARAAALFRQSCEARVAAACYDLGLLTQTGQGGVAKDRSRALDLFKQACDNGDKRGCDKVRYP